MASPITFSIYECSSWELWDDELARVLSLKLQPDKLTGTGRDINATAHIVPLLIAVDLSTSPILIWVKTLNAPQKKVRPTHTHVDLGVLH